MNCRQKTILLLTLIALPFLLTAQSASQLIIDSGHNTAVESLCYHSSGQLLSADNNGLVKVWDLATDKLQYQIYTGSKGSIQLKTHPSKKQFAILVSRPGYTKIAVWDWQRNKELFSKELSDRPIQFEFSAKGKYLFITKISSPSMVLMNSQNGREYSYLKRLYDIFSYGYIGASETRLMTYSNSGSIKYWDIRTSTLQNETTTKSGLSNLTVLQTEGKRYFLANKGNILFLIDRLTGSVRDTVEVEDMLTYSVDPAKGSISIIKGSVSGKLKILTMSTTDAHFTTADIKSYLNSTEQPEDTESTDFFSINGQVTTSLVSAGRIYLADSKGSIWEIDKESLKAVVFKKNQISDIRDLSFSDESMFILSNKDLFQLNSKNFAKTGSVSISGFSDLIISSTSSPLPGDSEIETVDNEKMIIWTRENNQRGYVIYNPEMDTILNSNYNFDSALNQLHVRNDQILVLENSGEASLNNIHTGFRDFQFSALGMVSLNFLNDTTLLGGKSLMKTGLNPMFTVQTDTGEIIPLQDKRFLIYDILSPADGNKTFTFGLKQADTGGVQTIIQSHSKNDPTNVSSIYTQSGEWIDAIFTADTSSYSPVLYGTVSGKDIIRISNSRQKTWDYDRNIEKIFFHNAILYILNTDGSLSLFNPKSGKKLMDYYMMEDGNWIAIPNKGDPKPFMSSSEASKYLNSFSSSGREIRNSYYVVD
ncbi:MAG: hypothetical protein B6241_02960 [Spirochaetaceae bacterium 4572_59]|nr:MAG: hypothetical protein B6241_02960 [Spirochaetaceae bacterium 4572_59]